MEQPLTSAHRPVLDEPEVLSKNEQKRRKRAAEKLAEIEAKAQTRQSSGQVDPLKYTESRCALLSSLAEGKDGFNAWPHHVETTDQLDQLVCRLRANELIKEKDASLPDERVAFIGRISLQRKSGKAICFHQLQGTLEAIQVVSQVGNFPSEEEYQRSLEYLNRGDIIWVEGFPGRTKTGELSVFSRAMCLVSPCFHMLPKGPEALSDPEARHRQRHLDFIVNKSARQCMVTRSRVLSLMRHKMEARGFMEVETPVFNVSKGGATARPFITRYLSLDLDVYLRIAPELALKMLVVGGMERVFELGKSFRNEGIDHTHNPEFTTMECYAAGMDYFDMMNLTEEVVSEIVYEVTGGYEIDYTDKNGTTKHISFQRPWARLPMIDTIQDRAGIVFPRPLDSEEALEFTRNAVQRLGVECTAPLTMTRMLDAMCEKYIEEYVVNPTIVMDHPAIMSPLAKYHRSKPDLTERFEVHVFPFEIANAYTELNNPIVQRRNFEQQLQDKAAGDDEAMDLDEAFITALEYGLPPTGGLGIGMDRIVMLVTGKSNIKDIISFPIVKPE